METEKKEEAAKTKEEKKSMEDSRIKETGQVTLNKNKEKVNIHLLTII